MSQQTISAILNERVRRIPSEDLARLIQEATGVSWRGWFTTRELEARARARADAKARARALRTGA